ncbi:MAG TPA: DUF6429 family protein [Xanthomonadales bacterium]|nr:DUF6429 family protein [Xanthomonadales bacterium]
MNVDESRVDDAILALLAVYSFDGGRAWKGFDFRAMDRLFEKGLIHDPKGKAKSVYLTPEGLERGLQHAETLFGPKG